MKIADLKRTYEHPALRNSVLGMLLLIVLFALIRVLDPVYAARLPLPWLIPIGLALAAAPVPATYRLVRGSLSFAAWKRQFFWAVIFVWGVFIGVFCAFIPRYIPLFFTLFVGGGGVGIGLYRRWTYIWNTTAMTVYFLTCLYFFDSAAFQADLPYWLLACLVVVQSANWIGRTSDYYISQNDTTARLLRATRRDRRTIAEERKKSDHLLLNILPATVAQELKRYGKSRPVLFQSATVLFTDFEGFTGIAEAMRPDDLVTELDRCFSYFDAVTRRFKLEKLKTIGDSYMCAGGVPEINRTHTIDAVLAALEIQAFMNRMQSIKSEQGLPYWSLRLGIHTGPLVAGVIGENKFAYDVWGDTVNIASRCESAGVAGRINVSAAVRDRLVDLFVCEHRGAVPAKHKGEIDMYFVTGLRPELSVNGDGFTPNDAFGKIYAALENA